MATSTEMWQTQLRPGVKEQFTQHMYVMILVSGLLLKTQMPATFRSAVSPDNFEDQIGDQWFTNLPAVYSAARVVSRGSCLLSMLTMLLSTLLILQLNGNPTVDGSPPYKLSLRMAGRLQHVYTWMRWCFTLSFIFACLGMNLQAFAFESVLGFVLTSAATFLTIAFTTFVRLYLDRCNDKVCEE